MANAFRSFPSGRLTSYSLIKHARGEAAFKLTNAAISNSPMVYGAASSDSSPASDASGSSSITSVSQLESNNAASLESVGNNIEFAEVLDLVALADSSSLIASLPASLSETATLESSEIGLFTTEAIGADAVVAGDDFAASSINIALTSEGSAAADASDVMLDGIVAAIETAPVLDSPSGAVDIINGAAEFISPTDSMSATSDLVAKSYDIHSYSDGTYAYDGSRIYFSLLSPGGVAAARDTSVGVNTYVSAGTDAASALDAVSVSAVNFVGRTDVLIVNDALSARFDALASLAEAGFLLDAAINSAVLSAVNGEIAALSDTNGGGLVVSPTLTEAVISTSLEGGAALYVIASSDAATMAESNTAVLGAVGAVVDASVAVDASSNLLITSGARSESMLAADDALAIAVFIGADNAPAALGDDSSSSLLGVAVIVDAMVGEDAASALCSTAVASLDAGALVDNLSAGSITSSIVAEISTLSDLNASWVTNVRIVVDATIALDNTVASSVLLGNSNDTVALSDLVVASSLLLGSHVETVAVVELIASKVSVLGAGLEVLVAATLESTLLLSNASVTDAGNLADAATVSLLAPVSSINMASSVDNVTSSLVALSLVSDTAFAGDQSISAGNLNAGGNEPVALLDSLSAQLFGQAVALELVSVADSGIAINLNTPSVFEFLVASDSAVLSAVLLAQGAGTASLSSLEQSVIITLAANMESMAASDVLSGMGARNAETVDVLNSAETVGAIILTVLLTNEFSVASDVNATTMVAVANVIESDAASDLAGVSLVGIASSMEPVAMLQVVDGQLIGTASLIDTIVSTDLISARADVIARSSEISILLDVASGALSANVNASSSASMADTQDGIHIADARSLETTELVEASFQTRLTNASSIASGLPGDTAIASAFLLVDAIEWLFADNAEAAVATYVVDCSAPLQTEDANDAVHFTASYAFDFEHCMASDSSFTFGLSELHFGRLDNVVVPNRADVLDQANRIDLVDVVSRRDRTLGGKRIYKA